ncbi:poly(A) polymerase [Reticulomyxa filosa]|uniref:Poly(A) polymerase n=1 Tax=Reticulomyxa filosa TaxID=46433 RepID=X6NR84_RETFI|nr:poly(A) polymerase [Reticulomyxa filosa]|eukprot:ETO28521.1 poly(A) polymerase [Reticulomyxa filosa]
MDVNNQEDNEGRKAATNMVVSESSCSDEDTSEDIALHCIHTSSENLSSEKSQDTETQANKTNEKSSISQSTFLSQSIDDTPHEQEHEHEQEQEDEDKQANKKEESQSSNESIMERASDHRHRAASSTAHIDTSLACREPQKKDSIPHDQVDASEWNMDEALANVAALEQFVVCESTVLSLFLFFVFFFVQKKIKRTEVGGCQKKKREKREGQTLFFFFFKKKEISLRRSRLIGEIKRMTCEWERKSSLSKGRKCNDQPNVYVCCYGSYELDVHFESSDMDLLCIGPKYLKPQDFFTQFADILRSNADVSNILVNNNQSIKKKKKKKKVHSKHVAKNFKFFFF